MYFFCNRKRKEVLSKPAGNIGASVAWLRVFLISQPVGQDETFFLGVSSSQPATAGLPPADTCRARCPLRSAKARTFWPGIPPTACHVRPCKNRPNRRKEGQWLVPNLTHTRHARHPPPQLWLSHIATFGRVMVLVQQPFLDHWSKPWSYLNKEVNGYRMWLLLLHPHRLTNTRHARQRNSQLWLVQ